MAKKKIKKKHSSKLVPKQVLQFGLQQVFSIDTNNPLTLLLWFLN